MTFIAFLALLAPFYAVCLFRATSLGTALLLGGRRPWACNVCMSAWASLLVVVGAIAVHFGARPRLAAWWFAVVVAWFGLAAITLGLLELREAIAHPPPLPPEIEDGGRS